MEFMVMSLLLTAKVEKRGLHVSRYNSIAQMNKPFISRNKNILLKTVFNKSRKSSCYATCNSSDQEYLRSN